jgi:hypothetical protein
MAALKYIIDETVQVIGPLREFYKPTADGKFALDIDGHPDTSKVSDFRATNIALLKERDALKVKLAAFEGINLEEYKTLKAKAAAGDPDDVVALKVQLATAEGKAAEAQAATVALTHKTMVSAAFLAAGGRSEAVDYIVSKAPFVVVDGALQPKPGEKSPTVEDWLKDAAIEHAYAFKTSSGGGSTGAKTPVLGAHANVNVLRNPSPQDLGKHSADIKSGKMKVEYTNT